VPSKPDTLVEVQMLTGRPVQLPGSVLARWLIKAFGWTLVFDGLPTRQGVLIAYPHTSNWDFVTAMTARWAIGLPITFWGKESLFRVPVFGAWLRWLGGVPVVRHSPQGMVGDMVQRMRQARDQDRFLWLALAPEGTRSLREAWRSGFHAVAVQAGVPLAVAFMDYRLRQVGVRCFLQLSGDEQADMAAIAQQLAGVQGKHPELATPIRLRT
jgi:1-acyl-sn-glycerol-3-phosphate acyltransferase